MNRYYIVYEILHEDSVTKSWRIVDTYLDLDISDDLEKFIDELEDRLDFGSAWLINWKRLDK